MQRIIVEAALGDPAAAKKLLATPDVVTSAVVLVIAGDRGLSGAYNTSALRAGERLVQQLQREGASVRLYCVGKKAPSFYRFRGMDVQQSFMGFVDRPSFSDARLIASVVAAPFIDGEVQKVLLVSTRFHSAGSQGVETEQDVYKRQGQRRARCGGSPSDLRPRRCCRCRAARRSR